MEIPRILFQTSKTPPEKYVVDMIREKSPGWEYYHYTDETARQFMIQNPLPDFPYIIEKFDNMECGPHKADLFRYYFLYVRGGVFIDSDAMIELDMENIAKGVQLFTVVSIHVPNTIFQGFLGTIPHNPVIYESLLGAYMVHPDLLKTNFHILCRHIYVLICKYSAAFRIRLFIEMSYSNQAVNIVDEDCIHIMTHYCNTKTIPRLGECVV